MDKKLTRREARENAFIAAFSVSFFENELEDVLAECREDEEHPLDAFGESLVRGYYDHTVEIDEVINSHLKGWTMNRLPRVSLVMLRLALSEIFYGEEKKPGVAINEAVEIVKTYGAETDYQFVNGLLGSVVRDMGLAADAE